MQAKNELEASGLTVVVPDLAEQMEQQNDYEFGAYAEQFDDANPLVKKSLIDAHFEKISQSDAVLIVNLPKHGVEGYIGPNVLMEMTVGYYLKKPIFLWHAVSRELPAYDEVMALQPVVLDGKLRTVAEQMGRQLEAEFE